MAASTPKSNNSLMQYAGLAVQWLVMLGLAVWGGLALDKKLGFRAMFVIIFPLLALSVSFWQLIRTVGKK